MTDSSIDEHHVDLSSSSGLEASPTKSIDYTAKILGFLASASNETLGACFLGLGAATYLVLGRIGLLLIGVVGGIVLHATWEEQSERDESGAGRKKRKDVALDVAKRLLDAQRIVLSGQEGDKSTKQDIHVHLSSHHELTFQDFEPKTAAGLMGLVNATIDNYVKSVALRE